MQISHLIASLNFMIVRGHRRKFNIHAKTYAYQSLNIMRENKGVVNDCDGRTEK